MFCGLGEEDRKRFRKKKKEKKGTKKKKKPHRGQSELVGIKKYLKTYSHVKYFCRT